MRLNPDPKFIPFPSIGQLRDAVLSSKQLNTPDKQPILNYTGKVKLHGTNAAIVIDRNGTYHCQSKTQILTTSQDNCGFANYWDEQRIELFLDTAFPTGRGQDLQVDRIGFFGEWVGGKISPNVALNQLPRMFVIFAVISVRGEQATLNFDWLDHLVNPQASLYNVDLFGKYEISIDMNNPSAATEQLKEWTLAVENECPAGKYFGVSGVGEGIVFTCPAGRLEPLYNFKSTGAKHKIAAKMGSIDPEAMAELSQLVDLIMRVGRVENRVEQAVRMLREQGHPIESTKETKLVVDWLTADIEKENAIDIAESSFDKKKVIGGCLAQGRELFKQILDRY
jgi:RNA ligase